jgi:hypothetical protein
MHIAVRGLLWLLCAALVMPWWLQARYVWPAYVWQGWYVLGRPAAAHLCRLHGCNSGVLSLGKRAQLGHSTRLCNPSLECVQSCRCCSMQPAVRAYECLHLWPSFTLITAAYRLLHVVAPSLHIRHVTEGWRSACCASIHSCPLQ